MFFVISHTILSSHSKRVDAMRVKRIRDKIADKYTTSSIGYVNVMIKEARKNGWKVRYDYIAARVQYTSNTSYHVFWDHLTVWMAAVCTIKA